MKIKCLAVECSRVAGILVAVAVSLLGVETNHIVDAQNGDGRFGGELQRLDLGDGWLKDARLQIVFNCSLVQVQAHPRIDKILINFLPFH